MNRFSALIINLDGKQTVFSQGIPGSTRREPIFEEDLIAFAKESGFDLPSPSDNFIQMVLIGGKYYLSSVQSNTGERTSTFCLDELVKRWREKGGNVFYYS